MNLTDKSQEELIQFAENNKEKYATAHPYPHIYFDNFFLPSRLHEVLAEFPDMSKKPDINFQSKHQVKLASKGEGRFGEHTKYLVHYLNSQPFLEFLSVLTGIKFLLPDPTFEGGGYHQIVRGGMLKVHTDFAKHPFYNLDRRINLLIYLNEDWEESFGGNFELWNKDLTVCEQTIAPLFNRVAIFSTTSTSFHGHPNPLNCPEDRSRKSIALYYYSNGRPVEETDPDFDVYETNFQLTNQETKEKEKRKRKKLIKLFIPPIFLAEGRKQLKNL